MQVMSYIFITEKSYFDSFKTFEVIDAESLIVIFFGTYGIQNQYRLGLCSHTDTAALMSNHSSEEL